MTAEEFKKAWEKDDDELMEFSSDDFFGFNLKPTTINFLIQSGLPVEAAPFLGFYRGTPGYNNSIEKLSDKFDFLGQEFDRYLVIGSDGGGNLIVIDIKAGDKILLIDHENNFSSTSINSSINTFAQSLIAYRNFVEEVLNDNGEDAIMDSNFSDAHFQKLENLLNAIDKEIMQENSFWKEQLALLLGNRDYFLNNQ